MKTKLQLFLIILFTLFTSIANAQLEKPKPAPPSNSKPAQSPSKPVLASQALVEVTWKGSGTVNVAIGEKIISLASGEVGTISVQSDVALTLQVQKPAQTYFYSDFIKFCKGKNFLTVGLNNGSVTASLETGDQHRIRLYHDSIERTRQVAIGDQIWMNANLDVDHFRNGDVIYEAQSDVDWKKAGQEGRAAWCYYNGDLLMGQKYGKLYNWYAVNDPRGIAPSGYHVASKDEYLAITNSLGGLAAAGAKMKVTTDWQAFKGVSSLGNNSSGWNGLPCGCRSGEGGFFYLGTNAGWWTTTAFDAQFGWAFNLVNWSPDASINRGDSKANGLSVRCIKD